MSEAFNNYNNVIGTIINDGIVGAVTENPWADVQGIITIPGQQGVTVEAFNDLLTNGVLNTGRGTYSVIRNANGTIRGYEFTNPYGSVVGHYEGLGDINSNLAGATYAPENLITYRTGTDLTPVSSGSDLVTATGGMQKYTGGILDRPVSNTLLGSASAAVVAAGAGIRLGKAIDGLLFNVGTAIGLNPPAELDPSTWGEITRGDDSFGAQLFNLVFDIDPVTDQLTPYVDIDAYSYMLQWLDTIGAFNTGQDTVNITDTTGLTYYNRGQYSLPLNVTNTVYTVESSAYIKTMTATSGDVVILPVQGSGNTHRILVASKNPNATAHYTDFRKSDGVITADYTVTLQSSKTINGNTVYYNYSSLGITQSDIIVTNCPTTRYTGTAGNDVPEIAYVATWGEYSPGQSIPGIVNNGNPLPDTSGWTSVPAVKNYIINNYPDLYGNRISNTITQPDGTERTYDYIPFTFPNELTPDGAIDTTTNPLTQTQIDPETATDTQLQTLVQMITDALTNTLVNPETSTQTGTNDKNPTTNQNPPDTGEGDGAPYVAPVGSASSLWAVYNPTQGELNSFGAWLWSSDFVDQLKRLFNDPMQAIIGVHKVYSPVPTGGAATIKCGYLDSGVSSATVSSQYTTVDCGSVRVPEYFGNVFDYDPYTKISIYLPFIGVVPLKTAEVMRSRVSVEYGIDVITGACLAKVKVSRDGGGGVLYSYGGSCACHYPISSGSYSGIISGVLSSAVGIATSAVTSNPLPAIGGVVSGVKQSHTEVQRSGGFTGCAGVMGPKKPYLIITRPQTRMAADFEHFNGKPANYTTTINNCEGYIVAKSVHFKSNRAYASESSEIENLLKTGILIND